MLKDVRLDSKIACVTVMMDTFVPQCNTQQELGAPMSRNTEMIVSQRQRQQHKV